MHNKRRHPRVVIDQRAWCEHNTLSLFLGVGNASRGGLFLQTGAPFLPGERLKLSFEGDDRIVCEVEVVWVGRSEGRRGCGVKFAAFQEGERSYYRLLEAHGGAN